jgi:hypothetical protein
MKCGKACAGVFETHPGVWGSRACRFAHWDVNALNSREAILAFSTHAAWDCARWGSCGFTRPRMLRAALAFSCGSLRLRLEWNHLGKRNCNLSAELPRICIAICQALCAQAEE